MSSKSGKGNTAPVSNAPSTPAEQSGVNGEWIHAELKQTQEKRIKQLREKGKDPFLKLPEGESTLTFKLEAPQKRINNFGKEVADFKVVYQGETYLWSVNTNSALYQRILQLLAEGHTKLKVIRVGMGKGDTRYSVRPA